MITKIPLSLTVKCFLDINLETLLSLVKVNDSTSSPEFILTKPNFVKKKASWKLVLVTLE